MIMDWIIVLISLFLLIAGVRRGGREDRVAYHLTFLAFIAMLHGLGFLLSPVAYTAPNHAYLQMFLIGGFACIRATTQNKGWPTIFALICQIGVLVYIIMGSFS